MLYVKFPPTTIDESKCEQMLHQMYIHVGMDIINTRRLCNGTAYSIVGDISPTYAMFVGYMVVQTYLPLSTYTDK